MARFELDPNAANIWTARIIPVILIGLVGYVSWVVIVLLCGERAQNHTCIGFDLFR